MPWPFKLQKHVKNRTKAKQSALFLAPSEATLDSCLSKNTVNAKPPRPQPSTTEKTKRDAAPTRREAGTPRHGDVVSQLPRRPLTNFVSRFQPEHTRTGHSSSKACKCNETTASLIVHGEPVPGHQPRRRGKKKNKRVCFRVGVGIVPRTLFSGFQGLVSGSPETGMYVRELSCKRLQLETSFAVRTQRRKEAPQRVLSLEQP